MVNAVKFTSQSEQNKQRRKKINKNYSSSRSRSWDKQIASQRTYHVTNPACVAGIIGKVEGEGEREKVREERETGVRGEGTPAIKTPFI